MRKMQVFPFFGIFRPDYGKNKSINWTGYSGGSGGGAPNGIVFMKIVEIGYVQYTFQKF